MKVTDYLERQLRLHRKNTGDKDATLKIYLQDDMNQCGMGLNLFDVWSDHIQCRDDHKNIYIFTVNNLPMISFQEQEGTL